MGLISMSNHLTNPYEEFSEFPTQTDTHYGADIANHRRSTALYHNFCKLQIVTHDIIPY